MEYRIRRNGCGVAMVEEGEERKNSTRVQQADHEEATKGQG